METVAADVADEENEATHFLLGPDDMEFAPKNEHIATADSSAGDRPGSSTDAYQEVARMTDHPLSQDSLKAMKKPK